MKNTAGGVAQTSHIIWTGDPPPYPDYTPGWVRAPQYTKTSVPSIQEQMGIDPISKLAAAIERLAAALEKSDEN